MKKLSATEAMNLYEAALTALPEISSLHVGFDNDKPVIIVTVDQVSEELERKIAQIAPHAPIKILQVGGRKQISARDAAAKYGGSLRKLKAVASVDVGRKAGQSVLMVRAFPLTETVRASVRSVAPDAPLEFKESRHSKHSAASVLEFLARKLRLPCLGLAALAIVLALLSPLYSATADIKFALGATTAPGIVVAAERPVVNPTNKSEISQEISVQFSAKTEIITFNQRTGLYRTLTQFDNMNAEPYHKGTTVTVSYQSRAPENTARIFDRGRFWATITLYSITILVILLIALRSWIKWQEW
ncbi:MAG: DUF3592 domain-containing protein [Rhodospirillaceae bacterium]